MSMIGKIRKGNLYPLYIKLLDGTELTSVEKMAILSIAIECHRDPDKVMQDLGYRILITYTIRFRDYEPLLNVAANEGYAPLVDALLQKISDKKKKQIGEFGLEMLDATMELFEENGIVLTNDQWELGHFFRENIDLDAAISAPTSFGKSELIIDYCKSKAGGKICILVPTKALVAQTRQRLTNGIENKQAKGMVWRPHIVMHPDSHLASSQDAICIYTQERFFRHFIMYKDETFDHVLVDEAHNVFGAGKREILLNQSIILHKSRADRLEKAVVTKFFTPFLANPENIKLKYRSNELFGKRVISNIKTEKYIVCDLRKCRTVQVYDQYFDRLLNIGSSNAKTPEQYIQENSAAKNIVYLNRPVKIQQLVKTLLGGLPDVDDPKTLAASKAIGEYVHPDYLMAKSLEKGVLYHHGSVLDVVKLYVEHLFSEDHNTKFIVCNSTLLEGVNIPATRLFLPTLGIGNGILNASQFKNLAGRVCRYKEIFGQTKFDESLLMPEIHIIPNHTYMHKTVNPKNYLNSRVRVDLKDKDANQNPLIDLQQEKLKVSSKEAADTFLDVVDPSARQVDIAEIKTAKTEVGYKSFIHNINEVDILALEDGISEELGRTTVLQTIDGFLESVGNTFISRTEDKNENYELRRLISPNWRNFYSMLLRWRIEHVPFSLKVNSFVSYWAEQTGPIFVGRWGDLKLGDDHTERWVNFSDKSAAERNNLAIVKIQDEYDFIETYISKFIELYYDLNLITEKLYSQLKYGTDDVFEIELIRAGFNNNLAKRLLTEYSDFVELVDDGARQLVFDTALISAMEQNDENAVVVFETKLMAGL